MAIESNFILSAVVVFSSLLVQCCNSFNTNVLGQVLQNRQGRSYVCHQKSMLARKNNREGTTTLFYHDFPVVETTTVEKKQEYKTNDSASTSIENDSSDNSSSSSANNNDKQIDLFTYFDDIGNSFKRKAKEEITSDENDVKNVSENGKMIIETTTTIAQKREKYVSILKSCLYFTLYVLYRSFRGSFLVLPKVFQGISKKLEKAVDSPFLVMERQKGATETESFVSTKNSSIERWNRKVTVSLLAAIVTSTYVVGGFVHILRRFSKVILDSSSVTSSFEAAADETEKNEERLLYIANNSQ